MRRVNAENWIVLTAFHFSSAAILEYVSNQLVDVEMHRECWPNEQRAALRKTDWLEHVTAMMASSSCRSTSGCVRMWDTPKSHIPLIIPVISISRSVERQRRRPHHLSPHRSLEWPGRTSLPSPV